MSARVQQPEILRRKSAAFKQRDRDCVAKREHHRCRSRWRQAERTGFRAIRNDQRNVRCVCQRTVDLTGYRDERNAFQLGKCDDVRKFGGFA